MTKARRPGGRLRTPSKPWGRICLRISTTKSAVWKARSSVSRVHAMSDAAAPQVGISIIPNADSLDRSRELVNAADDGGLELVGIQDHPYQSRFLDTFALVATLLAETRRISFFTDVANLPLRPPAVMAKAAASLDVLSGGRFELGLGAGGFP